MARAKKLRNGLTPKQDAFTKVVLKQIADTGTINCTQAALQIYNTAANIGSDNMDLPGVRERIEVALSLKGLSLSAITSNIGNLANAKPEKVSGEVVLKANVELLKLHGAYPDKKSFQVSYSFRDRIKNMSYQEAKAELEKLRARNAELLADIEESDSRRGYTTQTDL